MRVCIYVMVIPTFNQNAKSLTYDTKRSFNFHECIKMSGTNNPLTFHLTQVGYSTLYFNYKVSNSNMNSNKQTGRRVQHYFCQPYGQQLGCQLWQWGHNAVYVIYNSYKVNIYDINSPMTGATHLILVIRLHTLTFPRKFTGKITTMISTYIRWVQYTL